MSTEIKPFTREMLPEAGRLLASRHAANRARLPLLPTRFEDEAVAALALGALWEKKYKRGYAAFRNGNMLAYLLGEFTVQPWARCGYVFLPGYCLAQGESVALIQDLYTALGDDWVEWGVFSHGLYISAADSHVIQALFDLGFGKERVDALLDLRTQSFPETEPPAGVTIRRAGSGDNHHLGSFSNVISHALAKSPYWHPTVPEDYDELYESWSELPDEEDWTIWLAMQGEVPFGTIGFTPQEEAYTDMLASPRTVYLSVAATFPPARGRGVATALTWHGLEHARAEGFEVCYSNWISPNLLASRHWPRYGFADVSYRLAKRIDPQIAWTKGWSPP